ncbi:hypothetical protein [Terracidiphilus sp.]|uniref:hypothetical protein n=1 Tax=Terracidiphilus sp. TaxID=1964191 RepID=UPI003C248A67
MSHVRSPYREAKIEGKRGVSVFTVEPALNANTDDYAKKKGDVSQAERTIELQAYSDGVKTTLPWT